MRPRSNATPSDAAAAEPRHRRGRVLSWAFHPFVVGPPAMFAVGITRQGFRPELMPWVALSIMVIIGIPSAGVPVLMRAGLVDDYFVSVREQRVYLYPLLLVSFLAGGAILGWAGIDPLVVTILLSSAVTLVVAALVNLRLKLSLHCAGVAGIAVGIGIAFEPWGWLALLLLLPTAVGRVWARGHTVTEVVVGSIYGTIGTWIVVRAIYGTGLVEALAR